MSKVIQISEATSLAFHAIVLIGRSGKVINVQYIADVTGASRHHLAKVLQRLVKDKFVKSLKGPAGGFVLNKNPEEITLFDIYQSIEGPVVETGCGQAARRPAQRASAERRRQRISPSARSGRFCSHLQ